MRARFKPVLVDQWSNLLTRRQPRGPYCQTCRHWILEEPPDDHPCEVGCYRLGSPFKKWGIELLDNTVGMPRSSVLVRVFCHGIEEVTRIDLGELNWDERDLARAVERTRFFVPREAVQA